MQQTQRVLIIDDHQLFLDGIKRVLGEMFEQPEIELATNVKDAIDKCDAGNKYNLILVDLYLPVLDGFSFLMALSERGIYTPVIVISSSKKMSDIKSALEMGALGYVSKDLSSQEMQFAITRVLEGKIYLPDEVWKQLDAYPTAKAKNKVNAVKPDGLSKRQSQVFELIKEGASNADIATILNIEETTVKYHCSTLFKQHGVSNRTALVKKLSS